VYTEVSGYEEKLEVHISGMSCATVSLLPWVELNPGRKRCLVLQITLGLSQCQAALLEEGGLRVQHRPVTFPSPSSADGGDRCSELTS